MQLEEIILGPTKIGKAGFPIIAENSYLAFLKSVPHLFKNGDRLLTQLASYRVENKENESALRAISVLERVTKTAAITAPSDLWLLRYVFSTFGELGISKYILEANEFSLTDLVDKFKLDKTYSMYSLDFLHSRGYLTKENQKYKVVNNNNIKNCFNQIMPINNNLESNMVPIIVDFFKGNSKESDTLEQFFSYEISNLKSSDWIANKDEIELGFRLVPLVLAIRIMKLNDLFVENTVISSLPIKLNQHIIKLLLNCGAINKNKEITILGERIFARGPGPFGIIHAYHAYMINFSNLLQGKKENSWVARGENVSASQDANSKTFKQINQAINNFCQKYSYTYSVYIEHAVGKGEATRQRYEISGEDKIQYFGADLEDAAIDSAIESQKEGALPKNMKFIRNADIGKPEILIKGIEQENVNLQGAIMVVGNGFHEVRNQSNESMIKVFQGYAKAGIILAFTEESGLTDEDLIYTGWNTYHAGFRFVHQISGQGLRPAIDCEDDTNARYSWKKCASLAGFEVMEEFTTRTRTIYPHPRKNGYNPSISVNYFCVSKLVLENLKS